MNIKKATKKHAPLRSNQAAMCQYNTAQLMRKKTNFCAKNCLGAEGCKKISGLYGPLDTIRIYSVAKLIKG